MIYDSPFRFEVDNIEINQWEHLLDQFEDASLYQTWAFGGSPPRTKRVSHIVMKKGGEVAGCCQLRLKRVRFAAIGAADVNWGPLCIKKGETFDPEKFSRFLREIKAEYGIRRGYLLRISPHATGASKGPWKEILEQEGFRCNATERPYRTFRIDISPPLEELRANLLQKWRNCLNRAEKAGLTILEGTGDDLFEKFIGLADEMCERKKISLGVDYRAYRRIQADLPAALKMRILVGEADGKPVGAIVCSAMGNTGIYLLGATGQEGLKMNCSYLLQWHMIMWMKEKGIQYYDLGAFNPKLNPGVFHFKAGLAGKKECEEVFLNEYHGSFSLRGRIAQILTLRQIYRARLESLRNRFYRKAAIHKSEDP